jgi:hypothetical protein
MTKQQIRRKSSTGGFEKNMKITGWGIDLNGRPTRYYGHVSLSCAFENLKNLVVMNGAQDVHCEGNHLTHLDIPNSVEYVMCNKELFDYDKCEVMIVDILYEERL